MQDLEKALAKQEESRRGPGCRRHRSAPWRLKGKASISYGAKLQEDGFELCYCRERDAKTGRMVRKCSGGNLIWLARISPVMWPGDNASINHR